MASFGGNLQNITGKWLKIIVLGKPSLLGPQVYKEKRFPRVLGIQPESPEISLESSRKIR